MGGMVFMALGFGKRRGRDADRERDKRLHSPFALHAPIHQAILEDVIKSPCVWGLVAFGHSTLLLLRRHAIRLLLLLPEPVIKAHLTQCINQMVSLEVIHPQTRQLKFIRTNSEE